MSHLLCSRDIWPTSLPLSEREIKIDAVSRSGEQTPKEEFTPGCRLLSSIHGGLCVYGFQQLPAIMPPLAIPQGKDKTDHSTSILMGQTRPFV
ncbi:hypothetical protein AVEN_70323-1 [Araneus ventricosus]|uniref:Uncharacterized protein n=1 Tax=Araneus ventricosus TaxID=182803 RepID=A0A4Y2QRH5_ARAVE|nr:hypothetical protein AVEN_99426-1 [Araneus ventricosus]GBN65795.1 hypothetical protein AVEN_70323-1 [Araneus ventricosus]